MMRYDLTFFSMAAIKIKNRNNKCLWGCGEIAILCTVGGNIRWCRFLGKQYCGSSKNFKIELPAIPLLELKTGTRRDIFVPVFIAAFFATTKCGRNLRVPSQMMDKQMWYLHEMKYSALIRKEILTNATIWMTFKNIILNKPVTKRQIFYDSAYMTYVK